MLFVIGALAFFTGSAVGPGGRGRPGRRSAPQAYVGLVASFANVREITPLIAGVALAAKIGAGFTAEIGAQRISEEIDALEVIGVRPIPYLVSTRIWAALIPTIPLYLFALFIVVRGHAPHRDGLLHRSPPAPTTRASTCSCPSIDIVYSVIKAIIFTVVVVLIHTYYGFYAKGGPAGVGVAVGRAIRASITAVVVLNMVHVAAVLAGGRRHHQDRRVRGTT